MLLLHVGPSGYSQILCIFLTSCCIYHAFRTSATIVELDVNALKFNILSNILTALAFHLASSLWHIPIGNQWPFGWVVIQLFPMFQLPGTGPFLFSLPLPKLNKSDHAYVMPGNSPTYWMKEFK